MRRSERQEGVAALSCELARTVEVTWNAIRICSRSRLVRMCQITRTSMLLSFVTYSKLWKVGESEVASRPTKV